MIHIADHRPDPSWSTRFAAAIALVVHIAIAGGLAGFVLSLAARTALVAPGLYVTVATAAILPALMPAILHGLGWLFFALSPATV